MMLLYFVLSICSWSLGSAQDDLVETTLGPVLGSVRATTKGRHYLSWQVCISIIITIIITINIIIIIIIIIREAFI